MPTCWFSTTFSPDRPAKRPVGAVFRCVASGCRSAREPGCLYPKQRTAILRIATFSALTQQRSPDDGPELRPREGPLFLAYARADLASSSPKNVSAPRSRTARLGDSFYFAVSKIVESLLRRGARSSYPDEQGLPSGRAGPAYAAGAVPSGTRYGPSGRENILCPRAGGNRSNNRKLFDRFPTPAVARGGFPAHRRDLPEKKNHLRPRNPHKPKKTLKSPAPASATTPR